MSTFFLRPITDEFGWGRGETSAVAVLAMLGSAAAAPVAGRIAQRHGSRPLVVGSSVLFGAGLAGLAAAPADAAYVAAAALFIGVFAAGTTGIGHLVNLPRFFDRRLGLALGVATAGAGVGGAILNFVVTAVIGDGGWRSAYVLLAVVAVGCGAVSAMVGFPAGTGPAAQEKAAGEAGVPLTGLSAQGALRSRQAVTIFAALALIGIEPALRAGGIAMLVAAALLQTVGPYRFPDTGAPTVVPPTPVEAAADDPDTVTAGP